MKWISAVVVAVTLASLLPVEGRADCTITWDTGQPTSPAAGKVSGTGTFHLDAGYMVSSMMIYAVPTAGGAADSQPCTFPSPPAFSGSILGLPTGKYAVFAYLVAQKGMVIQTTSTATVIVNVP